MSTTGRLNMRS